MKRNNDILIEVNGVGKKFSKNLRKSMFYGLRDLLKAAVGLGGSPRSELRVGEFWAVRNVSFQLRRGEVLGLIGHNGAGKSTLLKMLNGLIRPDEGTITMRGRIGALIELGTGFNPILTGRENIYINGQILGFSKEEIDAKLESIIEFSEIRDFIDSPVQTYSSGMKVRLGFAVAAQMEPDILIIDEVLAVGDVGFRGKCMKVISEMMSRAAVIFVSHSMPVVNRYCNRGILLEKGNIVIDSFNIQDAIERYLSSFEVIDNSNVFTSGQVELKSFSFNDCNLKERTAEVNVFKYADIAINLKIVDESLKKVKIKINFINKDLMIIASIVTDYIDVNENTATYKRSAGPFNFQPGKYKLSLVVFGESFTDPLMIHDSLYVVEVKGDKDFGGNFVLLETKSLQ